MPHSCKLLVCAALALTTPALAEAPAPSPVYEVVPEGTAVSAGAASPSAAPGGTASTVDPTVDPAADPMTRDPRTNRPKLVGKPSGFWTSPRPAQGGAYRYRMLGIGLALLALTGLVTLRVLRRHGLRVPDAERPWAKPARPS